MLLNPGPNRPYGYDNERVIIYYDGPMLFTLPHETLTLLAWALPDEAGKWPFAVVSITPETFNELMSNKLTLRDAVTKGVLARYLLRDYDQEVLNLEELEEFPEDWLPGDLRLSI